MPLMRFASTRSSVLAATTTGVALVTVPGAIRRVIQGGDPYLFTERFFKDLWARLSVPGRFRFIRQPVVAIFLGVRDGRRGAETKSPAFLSWQAFRRGRGPELWRDAVTSVSDFGRHRDYSGPHLPGIDLAGGSPRRRFVAGARADFSSIFGV